MPAVYGDRIQHAAATIDSLDIGGAILMTWPDASSAEALAELKATNGVPVLLATDEEGGNVQRLRRLGELPSQADVRRTMTAAEARDKIARHAVKVADLGIDVVFAPVVDVAPPGGGGPIGDRAFSDAPATVSEYAQAYVEGWQSAGVIPVLKHFPGHGRASADSHDARSTTADLATLEQQDLVPYFDLAGRGAGVMVGHLDVPGLTDGDLPASLSPQAIGYLRESAGYRDALVFTDALNMGAITSRWSAAEAAVRSLAAGADVPIYADLSNSNSMLDAIVAAVDSGELAESRLDQAVTRVLEAKGLTPCEATAARETD